MLKELIIQNFAIIKKIDVKFDNGLSALTGETGAGKSIIIDSLGLLIGNRGLSEYVRTGTDKAVVQGLFEIDEANIPTIAPVCKTEGIDFSDHNLIIKRELQKNGRNICRINGELVTISTLKKIGVYLVDINGQNQSQQLLNPETHLGVLDRFGQGKIQKLLTDYQVTYQRYAELKRQLNQISQHQQERAQRLDMLKFQVNEIESAELQPDEEDNLLAERKQLANYERINDNLETAYNDLSENGSGVVERLNEVMRSMNDIAEFNSDYADIAKVAESSYYDMQDAMEQIRGQLDEQEYDPSRLEEIDTRLQDIRNLEKKYGASVADVLKFGNKARKELNDLESTITDPSTLKEQLTKVTQLLATKAKKLSDTRHEVAKKLTKQIKAELASMYMEKTVFEVHFEKQEFAQEGNESVEFYLQTNPGEALKPLAKIASGGELSRIMLALKTVLAKYQHIETLVFDEIDTGVSGRVAQAIGEKMSQIAQDVQVLCITHLPQVAAMSDTQFLVKKTIEADHTSTQIAKLSQPQRVDIISEMLEGTRVTEITKKHAQELLDLARAEKK